MPTVDAIQSSSTTMERFHSIFFEMDNVVARAVRQDPGATRWGAIVRLYVGDKRQLTIGAFESAIYRVRTHEELARTHVRARIYDRIRPDSKKVAEADAIWEEGQALRTPMEPSGSPAVPWCSGLLALLVGGHLAEATRVISYSKPDLSCEQLLRMLNTFEDAVYVSPFSEALLKAARTPQINPSDLKTLVKCNLANPVDDHGEEITDETALNRYLSQEATRLRRCFDARKIWTLSDRVCDAFAAGWSESQKHRKSPNVESVFLKYAAIIANDASLSPDDRKAMWRDQVTRWVFSHSGSDVSATMGIVQLHDLMMNSSSVLAQEVRRTLQFSSRGKDGMSKLASEALRGLKHLQINQSSLLKSAES
jgi:hypothetical protein